MWIIRIEYDDHSKCTLRGRHKDIPLRLAYKYYLQYARHVSAGFMSITDSVNIVERRSTGSRS